jgi:hypothetical protein
LSAEGASALAVTAAAADLEHSAGSVAVGGQVDLGDLVAVLDMLGATTDSAAGSQASEFGGTATSTAGRTEESSTNDTSAWATERFA